MAAANALTTKLDNEALARIEDTAGQIEAISKEFGLATLGASSPMIRALKISQGVQQLRDIITVERVKFLFMPLMGTPLGFLTDRDNKPVNERYSPEVVRDVIVEALLRGFMPTGNEFNIISDRFYAARNGLERQVLEYPGLCKLEMTPGVPVMSQNSTALVPYRATWILHGECTDLICEQKGETDTRIPVRVNSGMGPDAILGKAERKVYHRILKRLVGNASALIGPEDDEQAPINTTAQPALVEPEKDGKRMRLAAKTEAPQREPGED